MADFNRALSAADAAIEKTPDTAALARIRERVVGGGAPRRRRLDRARVAWACAGAAVLAAAVCFVVYRAGAGSGAPPVRAGAWPGAHVIERSGDAVLASAPAGEIALAAGQLTVDDEILGGRLALTAPARVRREADGVRVLGGEVEFSVDHRTAGAPPARVLVSHGVIEILGTRFTVRQGDDGGTVELHEGSLRFTGGERSVSIAPGAKVSWPLPVEATPAIPVPPPAPEATAPDEPPATAHAATRQTARRPSRAVDVAALLDDVEALRARGDFAAAATTLSRALAAHGPRLGSGTRERLSFELGSILSDRLADRDRACAHWSAHSSGFPGGRYADEIAAARERLRCSP